MNYIKILDLIEEYVGTVDHDRRSNLIGIDTIRNGIFDFFKEQLDNSNIEYTILEKTLEIVIDDEGPSYYFTVKVDFNTYENFLAYQLTK